MTNTSQTVKEISQMERVPERIVLGWIMDGALKARDVSEKASIRPRWRIDYLAWEEFCLSRMNAQPAPKSRRRKQSEANVIELYK